MGSEREKEKERKRICWDSETCSEGYMSREREESRLYSVLLCTTF